MKAICKWPGFWLT